ncbi:hypothetical protein J3F84DRAFT_118649 [Trichoderma pleuroticola]
MLMLTICGDEEPCRDRLESTVASTMDEPWPGLSSISSGCGGRELVSQHGCKVPCSLPGPALAQRPDRQRGTTDATVKGAASRGKICTSTHLQMLLRARHGIRSRRSSSREPFNTSMPLEALIGPYPNVWQGYAGSLRG